VTEHGKQGQIVADLDCAPISSGQPKLDRLIKVPAMIGPTADARLLGTAVRLAAAARSGGVTTAMT